MTLTAWGLTLCAAAYAVGRQPRLVRVVVGGVVAAAWWAPAVALSFVNQTLLRVSCRALERGVFPWRIWRFVRRSRRVSRRFLDRGLGAFFRIGTGGAMPYEITKVGETEKYYPEDYEEGDPEAPYFVFAKLSAEERVRIEDGLVKFRQGRMKGIRSNQIDYVLVCKKLVDWGNVVDDGEPVRFDPEDVKGMFDLLGGELQNELMNEYGSNRQVTEETEEGGVEEIEEADDDDIGEFLSSS